ncbi:flagellar basal body rod protein FlgB [Bacillus sp. JCM 19034]|uniref:flagellar basal body rod protein FlgB n=1 Tax=Bacillus sp. JCM 19034 TaxID=1481928 RepID=UPI000785A8B4|nr:flagellar basal body rod protein FlgB [Bacillus sp. JCM 19034]
MDLFGSSSIRALETGLNGAQIRQNAISQNIANVDTPNYKAKQVQFKHLLHDELDKQGLKANRTHKDHYEFQSANSRLGPIVTENRNTLYNHNGNNVDIDHEMSELAKNQIYYNALVDRLNGSFQSLETVIRGGR